MILHKVQYLEKMIKRHYVYAYCDTSMPCDITIQTAIGKIHFDFTPVYIGRGIGNRMIQHTNSTHNLDLQKLIESNTYTCFKIADKLACHTSYRVESEIIYLIGRKDLGTGSLFNRASGIKLIEKQNINEQTIHPLNLELNKVLLILEYLNKTTSVEDAAKMLDISPRTLYRYNKQYGITRISKGRWEVVIE